MFCKNCGAEIDDNAVICPKCGVSVKENKPAASSTDAPNMGFAVLGFFFPLIGLILYLIWRDTTPLKAKSCGKGALVGFIVSVVFGIIYGVIIGAALASL